MSSGTNLNTDYLIKLESVNKSFSADAGLKINVLEEINFKIPHSEKGTITTILAPFGSGKSTLLKIISGLTEPSGGRLSFNYNEVKKKIPFIPEKPSSFPWLSVKGNIEFALSEPELNKNNISQLISTVGLAGYENHFPHNKSFGFRFRITLARALAVNPFFILIDDSFKQMKNESRREIYKLLIELSTQKNQNFIVATTNLLEALQLSDKIILMSKKPGRILKEIIIDNKDKDHKSEKFTMLKAEIEAAFENADTLTTINYSV